MSEGVLPKSLQFPNTKLSAPLSYSINYEAYPSNNRATYLPGSTIDFDLPCGVQGQYLDTSSTYFKFSVTFDLAGNGATAEALAQNFIQTLTLSTASGSRQVEYISNYQNVHSVYRDLMSDSSNSGSDSICLNADPAHMRAAKHVVTGTTICFCLPLISIIGTLSAGQDGTMVPLCMLDSLKLSLQFATAGQALACIAGATGANYSITAPVLNLQLIRLQPQTQAAIVRMSNGDFRWSSQVIRTSEYSQNAGETFNSIALHGASFTSLRHLIASFRAGVVRDNYLAQSVGDRIRNKLARYRYRVNDQYVTPNPISVLNGGTDAYMQSRRLLGTHCTAESLPTLFNRDTWTKTDHTIPAANAKYGSLILSGNMSAFAAQRAVLSGASSRGAQVSLELTYEEGEAANVQACIVDLIACADALVVVAGGEMGISY
eukprot:2788-Heterococcus_DN1.PRE.10